MSLRHRTMKAPVLVEQIDMFVCRSARRTTYMCAAQRDGAQRVAQARARSISQLYGVLEAAPQAATNNPIKQLRNRTEPIVVDHEMSSRAAWLLFTPTPCAKCLCI